MSLPRESAFSRRAQIALALVAAVFAAFQARAEIKVGDAFPALAQSGLTGGSIPETAGHVTIVDFWASWCAPCKASFPAYAKILNDYADRGLVLVAVSVDEKKSNYDAFLKKQRPPFPTLLDERKQLVAAVKVPAMPTSYILGRDGRVRYVHSGFHGAETEKEIRAQLDALFAEKP
jgi:thiol-disulfide isomerase/thioredoxin